MTHQELNKKMQISLLEKNFLKTNINIEKINLDKIEFESFFYSLNGYKIIDTKYNLEAIKAINKGINNAIEKSFMLDIKIKKPFLSISFYLNTKNLTSVISDLENIKNQSLNFEIIELHLCELKLEEVDYFLNEIINREFEYYFSISITRKRLSNSAIVQIIQKLHENIDKNFIIEIDQNFSIKENSADQYDLEVLSTADIVNKDLRKKGHKYKKIPLIVSCKESLRFNSLAEKCSVDFNGINFVREFKHSLDKKFYDYKTLSKNSIKEILLYQ